MGSCVSCVLFKEQKDITTDYLRDFEIDDMLRVDDEARTPFIPQKKIMYAIL